MAQVQDGTVSVDRHVFIVAPGKTAAVSTLKSDLHIATDRLDALLAGAGETVAKADLEEIKATLLKWHQFFGPCPIKFTGDRV